MVDRDCNKFDENKSIQCVHEKLVYQLESHTFSDVSLTMRNSPQGNNELPSNLAKRNKLEFNMDENDYENIHPKTHEEEKEVITGFFLSSNLCFQLFPTEVHFD